MTKDETGLAVVLGHEIGQVVARHRGERLSQQVGVNAVVETLVGLSSGNPAVVQSVSALLGAGASVGVLLPWGRRAQESEATRITQIEGWMPEATQCYKPH